MSCIICLVIDGIIIACIKVLSFNLTRNILIVIVSALEHNFHIVHTVDTTVLSFQRDQWAKAQAVGSGPQAGVCGCSS